MARRVDIDAEITDLRKQKLTLSELHALSVKKATQVMDSNPLNWKADVRKSYEIAAINELIAEIKQKENDKKYRHRFDR